MVKTRSNKSNSGDESTTEAEIHTEYITDFERSADENPESSTDTVIRRPTKSQNTPIMSHQRPVCERRRRYPLPVDVRMREAFRPEVHSPKSKLGTNGELLESVAAMRGMMTTFMQAMEGMTETIVSVQCNRAPGIVPKPSVKTSRKSWSPKPVMRRRQKETRIMVLDEVLEDMIVLATQHLPVKMTMRVPQENLSRAIIDYQSSLGKNNGRSG